LAELFVFTESSDVFVFAGYRQTCIRILPLTSVKLGFNILATSSGKHSLPVLRVMKRADALNLLENGYTLVESDFEKCFNVSADSVYQVKDKAGIYLTVF
jgi:hypothetical protein